MTDTQANSKRGKDNEETAAAADALEAPARIGRSPIHLLHRAGQCAELLFAQEFASHDLTPRQYAVLVAAEQNEGGTQTDIVTMTGIDRSTLADLVRRLVAKGLLHRRRSRQDARAYNVKVTDEGRRLLKSTQDAATRVDGRLLAALPAADRAKLVELLDVLVRKLDPVNLAAGGKTG